MAINRFDRPGKYDWNMEHYVPQEFIPNFEAWDATLGQFQQEKNLTSALADKSPNAIIQDKAVRDAFVQKNQQAIDDLTELYASGDINKARAMQSQLSRDLARSWSPGGKAAQLESRYKQYNTMIADYKKKFKDDPAMMMEFAKNAIDSGINPGALSEAIGDPNVGAYINVGAELDKALTGFKSDKGTMIKGLDGKWIYKESNEYVTPDAIKRASNKILSQPRFKQQLGIEAWDRGRKITDADAKASYEKSLDNALDDTLNNVNKLTTKQLQSHLLAEGLDIGATKPDGIEGAKTKAAKAEYIKRIKDKFAEAKKGYNKDSFVSAGIMSDYIDPMIEKHAFNKQTKDVKHNPYYLQSIKDASAMKRTMLTIKANEPKEFFLHTPASKVGMEDVRKLHTDASAGVTALNASLKNSSLGAVGIDPTNAASILQAYKASGGDFTKFNNALGGGGDNTALFNQLSKAGGAEMLERHVDAAANYDKDLKEAREYGTSTFKAWADSTEGDADLRAKYDEAVAMAKGEKAVDGWGNKLKQPELLKNELSSFESFKNALENKIYNAKVDKKDDIHKIGSGSGKHGDFMPRYAKEIMKTSDKWVDADPSRVRTNTELTKFGGEENKRLKEAWDESSGYGFSPEGSTGEVIFRDDKGNEIDKSQFKHTDVQVGRNNEGIFLSVTTKDGTRAYARAELNSNAGDASLAQAALVDYSNTFDTANNPNQDIHSQNKRDYSANSYFDYAYKTQVNDNISRSITFNPTAAGESNVYIKTSKGDPVKANIGKVVNVANITFSETGNDAQIVLNEDGNYFVSQYDPSIGKMTIETYKAGPNQNRPKVYTTYESAKNDLANKAAALADYYTSNRYQETKSKQNYTRQSLNE